MDTHIMTVQEIIKYLQNGTLESIDAETALRIVDYYTALQWYEYSPEE